MATFKVKLGSSEGNVLYRQTQGGSVAEVTRTFRAEGYYVFSVARTFDLAAFLGLRRKIPMKQFILFNKEFRGLVRAGLPIVEGFDILLKRMKEGRLKTLLQQVREQLTKGESLSEAFKAFREMVPSYYPALLHAGEQSGGLEEVLSRFIEQEERIRKARKKFLQTLTYPLILLLVGMASLYIILTRAMPEFAALYQSSERDLPKITELVIWVSDFLTSYHLYLITGLFALLVAFRLYGHTERGAVRLEKILARIPVVGPLWSLQNGNIFARTMRLLLGGGIPLPQSLAIMTEAVPSRVFGMALQRVHGELLRGNSFQEALERHTHLGDMTGEMVRIGEATGTLGEMLEYVAEHGEERAEDYLELISGIVAPLVLLLVGLLVSFLVVAMYLPMFGSYESLGR